MLQNGTVINGTKIDKPHSFKTACTITTQVICMVSSNIYGGQTISLTHLAPFVDVSRQNIRAEVEQEFADLDVDADKINQVTEKRVLQEIKEGVQTLQYQMITMQTTNGQAPFVSVFMYLNEAKEPQLKHDLALIIEEVLKQRIQGVKNEQGVWITPAFPKLLYVLEEDNIVENTPYWYLTELAAQCTAKRLVPDYISEKIMLENKIDKHGDGQVYPCMGCVDGNSNIAFRYQDFNTGEQFTYDRLDNGTFEQMWNKFAKLLPVQKQPNGKDEYIDVSNYKQDKYKLFIKDKNNEWTWVKCIIRNYDADFIRITCENNDDTNEVLHHLVCTYDHPLETTEGVKQAGQLTLNDTLLVVGSHGELHQASVVAIESDWYDVDNPLDAFTTRCSYDVTTESEHFIVNGIYSHNCRSFLTPYVDPKTDKPKYYGRSMWGDLKQCERKIKRCA